MPATFSTLRVGELLRVTANVLDNQDNPAQVSNINFTEAGSVFAIISGEHTLQCLISGVSPGTDDLSFDAENGFFNTIFTVEPVTVLGGSQFLFLISGASHCSVRNLGGKSIVVKLNDNDMGGGEPVFHLRILTVDARFGTERGVEPLYAMSDGPNLSTDNDRVRFFDGAGWFTTSEDDNDVPVRAITAGSDVIHAFGTTTLGGYFVSGELAVTVVAATSVNLTAEPV